MYITEIFQKVNSSTFVEYYEQVWYEKYTRYRTDVKSLS